MLDEFNGIGVVENTDSTDLQCVVYTTDEGCAIVYPVGHSISEIILELPNGVTYSIIKQSTLPTSRVFRSAWRLLTNATVVVDMGAAKLIQQDRWRAVRASLLASLDILWLRAQETNDTETMATIAAQKQALRDVTDTDLSAVTTPEELETIWPTILSI